VFEYVSTVVVLRDKCFTEGEVPKLFDTGKCQNVKTSGRRGT